MSNNFSEVAKLLVEAAPRLAGWLLSPSANIAMQVISDAVGVAARTPEEAKAPVIEAIESRPDVIPKLQSIEEKYANAILPLIEQKPNKLAITIQIEWINSNEQKPSTTNPATS